MAKTKKINITENIKTELQVKGTAVNNATVTTADDPSSIQASERLLAFLANCLTGNFDHGAVPGKIQLYTEDAMGESQNLTNILGLQDYGRRLNTETANNPQAIATLKFIIPKSYIKAGSGSKITARSLLAMSANTVDSTTEYSRADLGKNSISLPTDTADYTIIINWSITLANK